MSHPWDGFIGYQRRALLGTHFSIPYRLYGTPYSQMGRRHLKSYSIRCVT